MLRTRTLSAGLAGALVILLTACTTSTLSDSRHTLYDTLEELAADSSAAVVVTVVEQHEEAGGDGIPITLSLVEVHESLAATGLAAGLDVEPGSASEGERITVRQLGASSMDETPAPILRQGSTYLLFVTPTMLPGDAADEYYVTGGDAGLYMQDGDAFVRLVPGSGDTLPLRLTPADL